MLWNIVTETLILELLGQIALLEIFVVILGRRHRQSKTKASFVMHNQYVMRLWWTTVCAVIFIALTTEIHGRVIDELLVIHIGFALISTIALGMIVFRVTGVRMQRWHALAVYGRIPFLMGMLITGSKLDFLLYAH